MPCTSSGARRERLKGVSARKNGSWAKITLRSTWSFSRGFNYCGARSTEALRRNSGHASYRWNATIRRLLDGFAESSRFPVTTEHIRRIGATSRFYFKETTKWQKNYE